MARRIITRDPHCTLALPGCTSTSTEADHIVPDFLAAQLGWTQDDIDSEDNGQGVCSNCHQKKSLREATIARRQAAQQRGQHHKLSRRRPKRQHPGLRATDQPDS